MHRHSTNQSRIWMMRYKRNKIYILLMRRKYHWYERSYILTHRSFPLSQDNVLISGSRLHLRWVGFSILVVWKVFFDLLMTFSLQYLGQLWLKPELVKLFVFSLASALDPISTFGSTLIESSIGQLFCVLSSWVSGYCQLFLKLIRAAMHSVLVPSLLVPDVLFPSRVHSVHDYGRIGRITSSTINFG